MKIAIVEPVNHYQNLKRAKEIKKDIMEFGKVDLLCTFEEGKKGSALRNPVRYLSVIPKLLFGRYDVIHFMGLYPFYPSIVRLLTLRKSKIVYDMSNYQEAIQISIGRSKFLVLITKFLEKNFINGSDYLVACGVEFHNFVNRLSKKTRPVYFAPDPIDIKKYDLALSLSFEEKMSKIGITSDLESRKPFTLAYLSTFEHIKVNGKYLPRGWDLIYSIEQIKNKYNLEVSIIFLGTGKAIEDLKQLALKKGVSRQCYFFGFVPDDKMRLLLTLCDLGYNEDYDTEGYKYSVGSKVQEYMAAGLPVLTGNSPEKNYMLRDQSLEFLLYSLSNISDQRSVDLHIASLSRAIYVASNKVDILREAGIRNRIRASRIFSTEVFYKYIQNIYNKLVS